jgi:hypothetical protein
MKNHLLAYLNHLSETYRRGDAREESYYIHLDELLHAFAEFRNIKAIDVTILPKKTEAGNPDFRIWDGRNHVTGYIEAKDPSITNLDTVESSAQLQRYMQTFPNVILTNFYEFRLYRDGERIAQALIARPQLARKLQTAPPLENLEPFIELFDRFFSFSVPKVFSAKSLATELAKRTRFLRDEVVSVELQENGSKGHRQVIGFYEAFQKYLIHSLSKTDFADLYSQTLTYGLFAARSRANGEFNRRLAFDYIPHTIGILRDVFRFISLEDPPESMRIIIDDISEILSLADVIKILYEYQASGKGKDPIIHFYETFLATYDPDVRERCGVYYTPEPVVGFIVRSIHSLMKTHFNLTDGLASHDLKFLDPAGGTLTFPAEAIRIAAEEYISKYGNGSLNQWIRSHILEDFYAFELMMAPYAIGHLKIAYIFEELGYKMKKDERFKLYLTNSLEIEDIAQINIPGISSLSEESHLAAQIKKEESILVICGNPPYSGQSSTSNDWTEKLLKKDIDGAHSYYKVDGKPLGEKNPKWLQDDYVKFIRFAQWKIEKNGRGIVAMITNHSYLDNPTFRGMRQSLLKSFDEIYILDLHGNSLKKEKTSDGGKDENVFDIRQGVAIALFIKTGKKQKHKVFHHELQGLRKDKYAWLESHSLENAPYTAIQPQSPYYFLVERNTAAIAHYLDWPSITDIFPVNSVGIVTARDSLTIQFSERDMWNTVQNFSRLEPEIARHTYQLGKDTRDWKVNLAQLDLKRFELNRSKILPIHYRPFDKRYTYYTGHSRGFICMPRPEVMGHLLEENIALTTTRQVKAGNFWRHSFITNSITESCILSNSTSEISSVFPLYLYEKYKKRKSVPLSSLMLFEPQESYGRKPNIAPAIFEKLTASYQRKPSPEEILHYIYGIFYSTIFRETYADFLKIDFPRVPFTTELALFEKMAALGEKLAHLHLMQSPLLEHPIAKYQGEGDNDRVEKIRYDETLQRVYINKDKFFEGVTPELWNVYIGGYQVLHKYLKDRKGRPMDDAPHYTRIVTALHHTKLLQNESDELYTAIESHPILSWEA